MTGKGSKRDANAQVNPVGSLKSKINILSTNENWGGGGHKYVWVSGEFQNNTGKDVKEVDIAWI